MITERQDALDKPRQRKVQFAMHPIVYKAGDEKFQNHISNFDFCPKSILNDTGYKPMRHKDYSYLTNIVIVIASILLFILFKLIDKYLEVEPVEQEVGDSWSASRWLMTFIDHLRDLRNT